MEIVEIHKNSTIKNSDLENHNPNIYYYLIVLNTPLNKNIIPLFLKLNPYIICGDGGANRFYDILETHEKRKKYIPNLITGDFDSLKPEIKKYYEDLGVVCLHDPCQDTTDFDKSMSNLLKKIEENNKINDESEHKVIITGCLGMRFDHNLSNFSNLLKYTKILETTKFLKKFTLQIIHDQSIITAILPGRSQYHRSKLYEKMEDVGIVPLSGPCKNIETSGLKWDLGGELSSLIFGEFISTSNQMVKDIVDLKISDPIFIITSLLDSLAP